MEPAISVIMPVYNVKEEWLKCAVDSILQQSFTDFEFIIIADRPTDNSIAILEKYAEEDPRIVLIQNKCNMGSTKSIRLGLERARGKYIARMDDDDIAHEGRFRLQYDYMESHPDVAAVGAYAAAFSEHGVQGLVLNMCDDDAETERIRMLFYNAGFAHSTAFIRKSFLEENRITYNEEFEHADDYRLWVDIINAKGVIRQLREILVDYRVHENQISQKSIADQKRCAKAVMKEQLLRLLPEISGEELDLHASLRNYGMKEKPGEYSRYVDRLIRENKKRAVYEPAAFEKEVIRMWAQSVLRGVKGRRSLSCLFDRNTFRILKPSNLIYYNRFKGKLRADKKIVKTYIEGRPQ